jgi:gliding motility-associated-like protein
MRLFLKYLVLIVVFPLLTNQAVAQITSPEASYSELTDYPSGANNDPVFYYTSVGAGSLNVAPGGTGSYTFTWYRYNVANNSFDVFVSSETGSTSSISNLLETGYRVMVDDGAGNLQTHTCWTFEPAILSVNISLGSESCYQLSLQTEQTSKVLQYYDPTNGAVVLVDYGFNYGWQSIPEGPISDESGPAPSIDAPVEDTEYQLNLTSRVGASLAADPIVYEAIAVKAAFTFEPESRGIEHEMDTTAQHSVPLVVRFNSEESKGNNLAYEWTFGEAGKRFEASPLFTYEMPGRYDNVLRVINEVSECEDVSEPQAIVVFESELLVPNVFTPNGDGINDEFRVAYRSIEKYNIVIYNRWGRKVYSSSSPAGGWDGKVGGQQASPGVYFYVIEAEGYQKEERYKLNGTITLIRDK